MVRAGELIQPLINLLNDTLLGYPVLYCDETRVQVLKEDGKPTTSHSSMWVRVGGPPTQPTPDSSTTPTTEAVWWRPSCWRAIVATGTLMVTVR